jgi:hypothetical protein
MVGVGVARALGGGVTEDPLEGEDVAAAHNEVAGENVAEVVDADAREVRAFEGAPA